MKSSLQLVLLLLSAEYICILHGAPAITEGEQAKLEENQERLEAIKQSIADGCCAKIKVVDRSDGTQEWGQDLTAPYGTYQLTDNLVNGYNSYQMVDGQEETVLWFDNDGDWRIGDKVDMEENGEDAYVYAYVNKPSTCAGLGSGWDRDDGGDGWEPAESSIVVQCL